MRSTALQSKLGLKHPLVAAPMFLISNREMLLACAEAGILGCMPSLNARTPEKLREDLQWLRARTDKPIGINMTLGLTPAERVEADLATCLDQGVQVLITSYGDPTDVVRRAKAAGRLVFHDVISLKHAQKAAAAGVAALIAVGAGAGGHAGRISPFVLVPWLKAECKVPVIAAGCISTGQQVVAALSLGADLCYLGTRFIASTECGASDAYKQRVVTATPEDIVYTDQVSGIHANFLKDTVPTDFKPSPGAEGAKRWKDVWSAGHGVGLIHDVQPIGVIVENLAREAHDALKALQ